MRALVDGAYLLSVVAIATYGFGAGSTMTILAAAALALPTSCLAVPGFYLAYGLLAQLPGANPSISAGSGGCSVSGACHVDASGDPAAWFAVTTDVIGVLALGAAALLNVVLLRAITQRRRPVDDDFPGRHRPC